MDVNGRSSNKLTWVWPAKTRWPSLGDLADRLLCKMLMGHLDHSSLTWAAHGSHEIIVSTFHSKHSACWHSPFMMNHHSSSINHYQLTMLNSIRLTCELWRISVSSQVVSLASKLATARFLKHPSLQKRTELKHRSIPPSPLVTHRTVDGQ